MQQAAAAASLAGSSSHGSSSRSSSSSSSSSTRRRLQPSAAAATEIWPSLVRRSRSRLVNRLNAEHGVEDFVEFYEAAGGLPAVYLMHPRGHTVEIHLQGATITRWLKEDGTDLLFTRSDAVFEEGEAINSGIPLAFPQWRDGALPYNGFADKLRWEVMGADLEGEFVNQVVSKQDIREGRARLLLDEDGSAMVPRPEGLIDEEDDWEELQQLQGLGQDIDAMYDQDEQAAAALAPKKKRGKLSKAEKEAEEAAAAAAAAAAEDAAAAAAAAAAEASPGSSSSDEEGEVELPGAAAAAADGADEEGQLAGDGWDDVDFGVITDPAPYVILRLRDNAETRAVWPHKFELYYKITLSESDDFPDPKGDLPKGVHTWTGSNRPMRPELEAAMEAVDEGDEETAAALLAAAEKAEMEEAQGGVPRGGNTLYNGYRMFTDEDGTVVEEGDAGAAPAAAAEVADEDDAEAGAEGTPAKGKRGRKSKAAAAAGEGDGGEGDDEYYDDGELPRDMYDPPEEPMQIRMEWVLINKDPKGSEPFPFQLAALSHFRTKDQMRYGELVRVLGLGGVVTFDYSQDPRKARLVGCDEDYVNFEGDRREAVYINSHDADVMFCPGSRTHFELMARKGLSDHVVWHPGALGLPGLELEPRFFAQVGAGRLALPKKLAPGKKWRGEYVIRYHPRYWDPPVFDSEGMQPMPQLHPRADDADDDDGLDDAEHVEGITSSKLGGGWDVPLSDE
ncbi:hypothetical protein OEZ85_014284 [Tetradesmus obliquus]|uniref:Glucose-6-phosphate 1-epimerase n=1 Tax=Tetradesmus obliquus TaxID=3088 RepID=A0ABY8U8M4_TETOB|nr:hypothetical protein OEZ85_014284 [Tetradesmus obliquus]